MGRFFSHFEGRTFTKKAIYRTSVCDQQNKSTRIEFPGAVNIPHKLHGKWVKVSGQYVSGFTRSLSGYTHFEVESIQEVPQATPLEQGAVHTPTLSASPTAV
jgi:hypothetical protein